MRSSRNPKLIPPILVLLVVAILSACGSSSDAKGDGDSGTSDPLVAKVGLVGPKSGTAPQYFVDSLRGFELAAPVVKERYGVTLDILAVDDKGSPETASREVQRLLNEENVDVIVGPAQSGPALQVGDIIQRAGRPWLVSVAGADGVLTDDHQPNWGFRTQFTNQQLIDVTASLLFTEDAKVGVVYSAEGFGQSNLEAMENTAKDRGESIVASESIQPGAPDMSAQVRRMKDSGANTLFIAVTNGADVARLLDAMDQVGYQPERMYSPNTVYSEFVELSTPKLWKNLVIPDSLDVTDPSYTTLLEEYEEEYGEPPKISSSVFTSYSAALLYGQAVKEAGDASDYSAVRDALEATESIDVNGRIFDAPFSADDHLLYDNDASSWFLIRFDGSGELESLGHPEP